MLRSAGGGGIDLSGSLMALRCDMNVRPYEIRWHGRGGQGAITAAKIMAQAAHYDGYRGVTAIPWFGAERRGAPVSASTRICAEPIQVVSQVEEPDMVVVLDQTLLKDCAVLKGLRSGGLVVVNSSRNPGDLNSNGRFNTAWVDATGICRELGLIVAGLIVVNTAMLGAIARASDLVTMSSVERAVRDRFPGHAASQNLAAIAKSFETTKIKRAD